MVVRCEKEVYHWFQNLDAASRIDFFCTLLQSCNPWEIRFFGTYLEAIANQYHHAQRHNFSLSNYQELLDRLSQSDIGILDLTHDIGEFIVGIALQRSRPPDIIIANIAYDIIRAIDKRLHAQTPNMSPSTEVFEQLIKDVRLLLAIAMHHPNFSFDQRQDFHAQMNNIIKVFGGLDCAEMRDVQCQTDSFQECFDVTTSSTVLTSPYSTAMRSPVQLPEHHNSPTHVHKQFRINDLTLLSRKSTKTDVIYTIQVKYNNNECLTVEKTYQDIRIFHDKMIAAFPDDVKSPKHIRNIPLFRGANTAADNSHSTISRYVKDLSKMKSEYLDSSLMHEFFLAIKFSPSTKSTKRDSSSKDTAAAEGQLAVPKSLEHEDEDGGSDLGLTLPMHTVIVTNSTKYPHSSTSDNAKSAHPRITTTAPTSGHHVSNQIAVSINSQPLVTYVGANQTISLTNQLHIPAPIHRPVYTASPRHSLLHPYDGPVIDTHSLSPQTILRSLRLHKYDSLFTNTSVEEMLQMSKEDLKEKGMVDGAAKKLKDNLDNIKRKPGKMAAHEFKDTGNKSAHMKTSFLNCDSSGSEMSSPRTSPHRHGVHVTSSQNLNAKQTILVPASISAHSTQEMRVKTAREVPRSQSSNNLYAFPTSPNTNMTSSADCWQKKSSKEMASQQPDANHISQASQQVSSSSSSSVTTYSDPSTSKSSKHAIKSPNSNLNQLSPRNSDRPYPPTHIGPSQPSRQKSDSGTTVTVEEIQQRQRQQALQRQQSAEVSISIDSTIQSQKPLTGHQNSPVSAVQQPSAPRPVTTAPYHPPHSPQSSTHITVSALPGQWSGPIQQHKSMQQPVATTMRGQQKSPLQMAPSPNTVAVKHRQPTPPPPLRVDNQPITYQDSQQAKPKQQSSTAVHPRSQSNLSAQSSSPVQTDYSSLPQTLSTEGPSSEHPSDESDDFNATEIVVSAKADSRPNLLQVQMSAEISVDGLSGGVENKDMTVTAPTAVVLQPPYVAANIEDMQYIAASMNGYKGFPFSPQDMDRVIVTAGPDGTYPNNGCMCQNCIASYWPAGPPPRPPTNQPPPSPMSHHQNGIVYRFAGGYMNPHNGMINPAMHNFNRPNSQGGLPNGMVQRNDVVYQQVPFMAANTNRPGYHTAPSNMPPQQYQQPPSNYHVYAPFTYTKRQPQCANCGLAGHTRTECPEPVDNSSHINDYRLDILPRSEVAE